MYSGGEKEAEDGDKLSGGFSEDGFPTASSSSCYTLDSSEEEADAGSGTVTSPATYTDGLSPTARQLAKIAELSVKDDKASLLMRMAPQGSGKVRSTTAQFSGFSFSHGMGHRACIWSVFV